MRRALALLLPLPAFFSCSQGEAPLAQEQPPAPATSTPAFDTMLGVIAKDRRQFALQAPGFLEADIRGVLRAELSAEGLAAWAGDDLLALRTVSVAGQALRSVDPALGDCAPTSEQIGTRCAPAAELRHDTVTEWWTSGPLGVRQGWTLSETPGSDEVTVRVALDEGELLRIDADGSGATLRGSTGQRWRYEDLQAWDANGTALDAELVGDFPDLLVVVDVEEASWPVTIDPLLGPANTDEDKISATDGAASDGFGYAVASAGDLDADGYDDVIVGAAGDDSSTGAVYVYYGSSEGISTDDEDKVTASDAASSAYFGYAVSGGCDIDGDGYDDIVVGAYGDGTDHGAGYVYFGSSYGLASDSEEKLTASDAASGDKLGSAASCAGDIDGDGYDDVVLGAFADDDGGTSSGAAYVYYGSSSGISSSSEDKLTASDGAANDNFGWFVTGAGDLDGDGYADVAVSAWAEDGLAGDSGSVYVYYGSSSGISTGSEAKLNPSDGGSGDHFGYALSGAGDVDGDGVDDLVVGARQDDDAGTDAGAVYVYLGSSTGLSTTSEYKLTASDGAASDGFGSWVAHAGDLDADGYADLVVGASGVDDDGTDAGAVYVYYGSANGISSLTEEKTTASDAAAGDLFGFAAAGAGDVDGDGHDDLVIGAYDDDDAGTDSGSIYLVSTSSVVVPSDSAASDGFAFDLSSAGDVDGDGYDDVVVGAYGDDDNGSAYVYYGSASGISIDGEDKLLASDGADGDQYGYAVSGAGDVDGDGYDDVVVGAFGDDDNGSNSGSVYLYHGSASGIDASSEQKLGASDGAASDYFGLHVSGGGDVDSDGYDDVVVGAYGDDDMGSGSGSLYLYYGSATGLDSSSEEKQVASDGAAGDYFGYSVSVAGDVDGDGYADLLVGAISKDDMGSNAGAAYVYYGSSTGLAGEDLLLASDGADGDIYGWAISGAGDLDSDGYDDVVVGSGWDDDDGSSSGSVYVYYGSADGIDGGSETKLTASDADASDTYGFSVATAGDVDGDGYDDLLVGSVLDDDMGSSSGSAYVYFGAATGVSAESELKLTAADGQAEDQLGFAVSQAGDLDGDGYDDVIVGAWYDGGDGGALYAYAGGCRDQDGDGFCGSQDCDDTDASIHPDATESEADGVDQDCDGIEICYADADGDGYTSGTVSSADTDCSGAGEASAASVVEDCDDADATVHPGAVEVAGDELDQDCDGTEICYLDVDEDGYLELTGLTVSSSDTDCADAGEGSDADAIGDCDDADATVHPGAVELVGDELDQDCDGLEICYADLDDDGYIDGSSTVTSTDVSCSEPGEGTSSDATGECDDTDATVHPGAIELVGDEVDSDCDGTEVCYLDEDDDGYTDGVTTVDSEDDDCSDPGEGTSLDPIGDCDDADAAYHPGATEDDCADPNDYNCDGSVAYADADGDGWIACEECDDGDSAVNPDATEVCDDIDNDCDGETDPATSEDAGTWYSDADGDGYGDEAAPMTACDQPEDAVEDATDCDDTDESTHPGAPEVEDDGIDQDCDGVDATGSEDTGPGDTGTGGDDTDTDTGTPADDTGSPTPGTGNGPPGDEAKGCSCSAGATSSTAWFGLLALPLFTWRRRR